MAKIVKGIVAAMVTSMRRKRIIYGKKTQEQQL